MKKIAAFLLLFLFLGQSVRAMSLFEKQGHVTVLTYHRLSENPAEWNDYCISPALFEQDLCYLFHQGYEFLTATQLAQENLTGRKIAVLTFDDGYDSDLKYALPLLEKHGARATFFLFGRGIDTKGYLTSSNIQELSKHSCAEIGNHSYELHSLNMSTLSLMYRSGGYNSPILADYEKNDVLLRSLSGKTPSAVSYPNGVYSAEIDQQLKNSGKLVTFSTWEISFGGLKPSVPVGRKNRSANAKIEDLIK